MNSLQEKFNKEIKPTLMKEFGYSNVMQCPKIEKVSVNVGLSQANENKEFIKDIENDLKLVIGQAPVITKAKKSIAGFKTRQGQSIGMKATLRGEKMWDFVYRLVGASLPRIKDFRGLEVKSFDNNGNFSIGIKEHLIFPEISTDNIRNIFGFQVNISTNVNSKEEGIALLRLLGFPIKKDKE
jgi:large subunit ribosomal protein L5